jgi:hypothetical protein
MRKKRGVAVFFTACSPSGEKSRGRGSYAEMYASHFTSPT